MSGLCKGSTIFMNFTQQCTDDAYADEDYCLVHLRLILKQRIAELDADRKRLEWIANCKARILWTCCGEACWLEYVDDGVEVESIEFDDWRELIDHHMTAPGEGA